MLQSNFSFHQQRLLFFLLVCFVFGKRLWVHNPPLALHGVMFDTRVGPVWSDHAEEHEVSIPSGLATFPEGKRDQTD